MLAISALTALFAAPSPGWSSPEDLRSELQRFQASGESAGLVASVTFRPLGTGSHPGLTNTPEQADSTSQVDLHQAQLLIPASVTKLVTTIAALDELGPRHTFRTRVLASAPMGPDGTLDGDLVVVGGGDPFLVSERLWMLANQLRQTGLREVRGDLWIDASRFAMEDSVIDRVLGDSYRAYSASPTAFAVNFNALAVHVQPGAAPGAPALVTCDPIPCDYLEIDNLLQTGPPGRRARGDVDFVAAGPRGPNARERLIVRGSVPAGGDGFVQYRKAEDARAFSASMLRAFLGEAGIQVNGSVHIAPGPINPPAAPATLLEFESEALEELLARMNRHSSNFIANQVAMGLAAERADSANPVSLRQGGAALTSWMRDRLGTPEGVRLEEGSGLSTENRLSAAVLVQLLDYGWTRLGLLPSWLGSLPEPGEDGTLENRFRGPGRPVIHAKTGTLAATGVSSLAGVFEDPHRGPVAFAILMNATDGAQWTIDRMQQLQERWILAYLRY